MFKVFKFFHIVGLTMFLGSIWIYIAQGTPMDSVLVTTYVRTSVANLIAIITLPGLLLMLGSGVAMVLARRGLLTTRFFKIKLGVGLLVLINALLILSFDKQAAIMSHHLPEYLNIMQNEILKESIVGALNVLFVLFLIGYSLKVKK